MQGSASVPRARLLGAIGRLRADGDRRRRRTQRSPTISDSRVNVKVGFTPNDTDEYSLSYTAQAGEKGAPLHVLQQPAESAEQLLALAGVGHR